MESLNQPANTQSTTTVPEGWMSTADITKQATANSIGTIATKVFDVAIRLAMERVAAREGVTEENRDDYLQQEWEALSLVLPPKEGSTSFVTYFHPDVVTRALNEPPGDNSPE